MNPSRRGKGGAPPAGVTMDDMNRHLDEGTIHAWLDGALAPDESARVERHAASCAGCGALVAEARGLAAASSRILSALDGVPADVIPPQVTPRDQLAALRARRAAARPPWWRRREFLVAASLLFVAGTGTAVYQSLGGRVASSPATSTEPTGAADAAAPRTAATAPVTPPPAAADREQQATMLAAPDTARRSRDLAVNPEASAIGLRQDAPSGSDSLRIAGAMVSEAPREEAREAKRLQPPQPSTAVTAQASREAPVPRAPQAQSSALSPAPVQRLANEADFAGKGAPAAAPGLEECYELRPVNPASPGGRELPDRVRLAPVAALGGQAGPELRAVVIGGAPGTTLAARPIGDMVELLVRRAGDSTLVRFQRSASEAPPPPAAPGTTSLAARRIRCGG